MKLGRPTSCLAAIAAVLLVSGDGSCCLPVSLPLLFVFRSYTLAAFQPPKPTANPVTHGRIAPVISAGFDSGGPIDVKLTVYSVSTAVDDRRYNTCTPHAIRTFARQPRCFSIQNMAETTPTCVCKPTSSIATLSRGFMPNKR